MWKRVTSYPVVDKLRVTAPIMSRANMAVTADGEVKTISNVLDTAYNSYANTAGIGAEALAELKQ